MILFTKTLEVRWSDIDANQHVTHTSYAQFATHTRVEWMQSLGFSITHLLELGYMAVLLKEETEYYREVFLGEKVRIDLLAVGQSSNYAKWKFQHNIYNSKNKLAARHLAFGAWIRVKDKKISPPPQEFISLISDLPYPENFENIPN